MLAYVRLQMQTYHLASATLDMRVEDLLSAHNTATVLVDRLVAMSGTIDSMQTAPGLITHALILAASVNLKITKSVLCQSIDQEDARRHGAQAVRLLRHASLQNNDARAKAARTIEQLWFPNRDPLSGSTRYPGLATKSRETASIIFDSIRTWQQQYGARTPGVDVPENPLFGTTARTMPQDELQPQGPSSSTQTMDSTILNQPNGQGHQGFPTPQSAITIDWDEAAFNNLFPDSWAWLGADLNLNFTDSNQMTGEIQVSSETTNDSSYV